ncbi:MAG: hypothetical protein LWY06_05370 [Firmicutes bacterium]|nr:hypothetical protein [Bacillota bacterium]
MKILRKLFHPKRLDDSSSIIRYCANKYDGVVIGDPFCQERTGISLFDIPDTIADLKKAGLFVSYQTPVYLTGENFDIHFDLLRRLIQKELIDEIRIQDIGFLNKTCQILNDNINICWTIYGWQREFPGMDIPLNQGQISFLEKQGVISFEVTTAMAFSIMDNDYPLDFNMQIRHYRFDPSSFSRKCYTESYTEQCCRLRHEKNEYPCDKIYFLADETGMAGKYAVESHRIMELPEPGEFEELMESDLEAEALIIEE